MISINTSDIDVRSTYFLMTSLVVPRPIAWVSTLSPDGVRNLAPYSHFNNCSSNPPIVQFVSNGEKDTLKNIRAGGEYVINVVSKPQRHAMRVTAATWPKGVDEFEMAGLDSEPSSFVAPPRVRGARAAFECRLRQVLPMGEGNVIFGDILCFHLDPSILVDGRVDSVLLEPVGKLAASNYSTVEVIEQLNLPDEIAAVVEDFGSQAGGSGAGNMPVIA